MLSAADFYERFPEFKEVDGPYIDLKLSEAARCIDPDTWGKFEDDGHGYLTAHLLALSPMGNAAKLVNAAKLAKGDCATTYEWHYRRLQNVVTMGLRTT